MSKSFWNRNVKGMLKPTVKNNFKNEMWKCTFKKLFKNDFLNRNLTGTYKPKLKRNLKSKFKSKLKFEK